MLEHPVEALVLAQWAVTNRGGRAISRKGSGGSLENPQRLYARPGATRMRQSDLHGNVQSAAEMTAPASREVSNKTERS
jgi:hypothetical protein